MFKSDILPIIIETLEQIIKMTQQQLVHFIKNCDFEFLITLLTISKMLVITYQIPIGLQKSNIDLSTAIGHIELVQSVIDEIRLNVENEFKQIFEYSKNKR